MKNSHDVLLKEAVFGLPEGFSLSFVSDYSQTIGLFLGALVLAAKRRETAGNRGQTPINK
jgi:hypothetical protein